MKANISIKLVLGLLLTTLSTLSAPAASLAYEGFDYLPPGTPLNALSGGSGFAPGGWAADPGVSVQPPGLSTPLGLASMGLCVGGGFYGFRQLANPLNQPEYWVSYMIQASPGNDMVYLGLDTVPSTMPSISFGRILNNCFIRQGSTMLGQVVYPWSAGSTDLLVAHIKQMGLFTQVELWVNPPNFTVAPTLSVAASCPAYTWVNLQVQPGFLADEIRIGETSGDVAAGASGPPTITSQPQNQTVACRSNVTFVVAASGSPPLSYQWSFDGIPLAGGTDSVLALDNVSTVNGGTYSVTVSNSAGGLGSDPALLTVTEAAPRLSIVQQGTSFVVQWDPTCTDFGLEENISLVQGQSAGITNPLPWIPSAAPVSLVGGKFTASIAADSSMKFFRLRAGAAAPGSSYNPYGVAVDPLNMINSVMIDANGSPTQYMQTTLTLDNFSYVTFPHDPKPDDFPPPQLPKISPVLTGWLQTNSLSQQVPLIVTFVDKARIPLLPELTSDAERGTPSNRLSQAVAEVSRNRLAAQAPMLQSLHSYADFSLVEQYWLVNAAQVSAQLGAVQGLSQSPDVAYIQPVEGGELPPIENQVDEGRTLIVSDPYYNLGLTAPWIGLIDTGVRASHVLFNAPSHLAWLRDCVNGGGDCNGVLNPGFDTSDGWNHGTSTAAIITGNNRLGNDYRGVTAVSLDSWKVYPNGVGLNSAAAIRAIQNAVTASDKVLVGEMQAAETENGAIATAADNAYNAGAIFVSANGNNGPNAGTVNSPAIAHKVLGVGGFMVDTLAQYNGQSRGPATDGRYKPDIQTPTWSETASDANDTALQVFTGTSGATPYASAAAMLGRNWLRQFGIYDNGQTYAFMILYGQHNYPYDNTVGAGPLKMEVNGWGYWGKLAVLNGQTIDIPINVPAGRQNFEGALWWPETVLQPHNDLDLFLVDPTGVVRASGVSAPSIFERATVAGPLAVGTWKVRIRGYSVPTFVQVVYWAAAVHF
jgi:serine protease AprX